jgi:hypothetical protein
VNLTAGVGLLDGDGQVAELDVPYGSVADLLSEHALDTVADFGVRHTLPLANAQVRSLGCGASVWGIGLNYRSKMTVSG